MTSEPLHALALDSPLAPAPSSTRYKAKIDRVSPLSCRTTFEQEPECFLGISLENSNFVRPKLAGMVEWIARRFQRCNVLVGDSIHRITLESLRGMDPDTARARALALGREFMEREREVFANAGGETKFTFVTCSEVQRWENCTLHHRRLTELYANEPRFRASVDAFAHAYHGKRADGLTEVELQRRLRSSAEYFLEEFAIISCMRERGSRVMVYPGSFSTLAEIANGDHPDSPTPLHDLVTVALCLKGR